MGEQGQTTGTVLDIEAIKKLIPHRWPFLFVEKLSDIVPFESANGWKAVSFNEPHFQGHFPELSVMPGVLIVEALAQTAGALIVHSMALKSTPLVFFMGIDKARFRKPVIPGDQLILKATVQRALKGIWKFETMAMVGDTEVAHAEMMVAPETGK